MEALGAKPETGKGDQVSQLLSCPCQLATLALLGEGGPSLPTQTWDVDAEGKGKDGVATGADLPKPKETLAR